MNESVEASPEPSNYEPIIVQSVIGMEEDDLLHSLDPRFINNERLGGWVAIVMTLLVTCVGLTLTWLFRGYDWLMAVLVLVSFLILLLLFFFALVWPKIYYRHARWRLDNESLEIRRGVFWKHRISVPLGRVQHADVSQGPFQRRFGIGKLTVHTAGTSNASVELDGLEYSEAIRLRDLLVRQTKSARNG